MAFFSNGEFLAGGPQTRYTVTNSALTSSTSYARVYLLQYAQFDLVSFENSLWAAHVLW